MEFSEKEFVKNVVRKFVEFSKKGEENLFSKKR